MNVRRLLAMPPGEIVGRGRQEAAKLLERLGLNPLPKPGAAATRPEALERFLDDRFFEGPLADSTLGLLATRAPGRVEETVQAAGRLQQGSFDLLAYRGLSFGDLVDWRLDPVSGRRSSPVHWSRMDPLDVAAVGDSKVVWELNRHQWFVRLGQAYRLTEDDSYARIFARHLRKWLEANPPGAGINWASSLEVALRLIAWCWALALFRRASALTPRLMGEALAALWDHAAHVERYRSHYFSPNTHLTGEALGLFYAGLLFQESRRGGRWLALGQQILEEQIERQVLPDGVYFEQSTCYQRYTVEIYHHFLILAARNGIPVPARVGETVQRLLDLLLAVRAPDGGMPQIGDADGGCLLPLGSRQVDDLRGVFSTGAAWFGRPDYAWAAGGVAPEALWLLGPSAKETFEALRPAPPAGAPSRFFAHGGYAVMRSGWKSDAHHLIFDVGPLGCPVSGAHGHADLLSIQCSAFGEPFLTDPGTYGYTAEPAWRDFFRSTAAHSTVVVDGHGQALPAGPFRWSARPRAQLHRWLSTGAFDFADASHDAYRRLPDPVVQRRRVLFVKPRYWVVVDDLDGGAEHQVELRFQFAPMEVTLTPDLWARAVRPSGRGLLIRPFAPIPLKAEIHEGERDPIQGWVSFNYGQRQPAPVLVYSIVTRLPFRIMTVLWPTLDPSLPPPAVVALGSDEAGPTGVLFEGARESIWFQEDEISVRRG